MNDTVTRLTQALTSCIAAQSPTPPGKVRPVANWLRERAEDMGASYAEQPVTAPEVNPDPNVLIELDFGPGPRLVFNTHMDVNAPDVEAWSTDPWDAVIADEHVFGVGACDAKGSLVAMVEAMAALARSPQGMSGRLLLTAVMGEEAGGIGSRYLVARGLDADGAIVGEPTGLAVACAHKGTYMRRIRFTGRTAHSSSPAFGRSAVAAAADFIGRYEQLNEGFTAHPHPLVGPPSAVVTLLSGGERQNTVPATAELVADRRLVPGEDHAKADGELATLLTAFRADHPDITVDKPEVVVATVPSETATDAAIVHAVLGAASVHRGEPVAASGFPAGCDMSKLVTIAGIPTVVCGPGDLAYAHRPDERVPIAQVVGAATIYEGAARQFLARDR